MARNSDLDILLTARLDTKDLSGIKGDVKTISDSMVKSSGDSGVLLKGRLDTSDTSGLVKDAKVLSDNVKGDEGASVRLDARLNLGNTDSLIKDIKTLSEQLKKSEIELNMGIKDSSLKEIKSKIDEVTKSMDGVGGKGQTTSSPFAKTLTDVDTVNRRLLEVQDSLGEKGIHGSILKVRQASDTWANGKIGEVKSTITDINTGLGETHRVIQGVKTTYDRILDPVKAQKQIYTELTQLAREESRLKEKMMTQRGVELKESQRQLDINNQSKQSIQEMIKANESLYFSKEREVKLQKEMAKLLNNEEATRAKIAQNEVERVSMLGQKVSGEKGIEGFDHNDINSVNNYVKAMMGAEVQVAGVREAHTKLRKGISDTRKQIYEVTAQQQIGNKEMRDFKFIVDENSQAMYKMGESIKPIGSSMMDMVGQMGHAIVKSAQWAVAMDLIYGNLRRLKEGIQIVKDLDAELTQVAVTLGQTRGETKAYADTIVNTAIDLRRSVADVSAVNTELVRQGLSLEEAQQRMETVMKLSSVGGMDASESLRVITSSVNALGESAEKTADVLVRAGQISASSASEIGEAFTKTASGAKATGVEMEELGAILSVLVETTQESPSSLGNSLKTLISRFNSVNEETGELNKDLNKVQTAFESVGVAFTDADGQIRPLYELLEELSGVWGDLDKNTRSYVSTQAAGKIKVIMPEHTVMCA